MCLYNQSVAETEHFVLLTSIYSVNMTQSLTKHLSDSLGLCPKLPRALQSLTITLIFTFLGKYLAWHQFFPTIYNFFGGWGLICTFFYFLKSKSWWHWRVGTSPKALLRCSTTSNMCAFTIIIQLTVFSNSLVISSLN